MCRIDTAQLNANCDVLVQLGRGLSHCPFGVHRVSLLPVTMVYPGKHLFVVSDPGVSPADKKSSLELSGTRIFSHRISVKMRA